jgi:hypothetical protein
MKPEGGAEPAAAPEDGIEPAAVREEGTEPAAPEGGTVPVDESASGHRVRASTFKGTVSEERMGKSKQSSLMGLFMRGQHDKRAHHQAQAQKDARAKKVIGRHLEQSMRDSHDGGADSENEEE